MDLYGRLLHDVLFPGFEAARGRPTVGLLRYLDRTQWASRDELAAIQSGYLRRLIRHAYEHTAHYRQALDAAGLTPADLRRPEDLARLPLLEKEDARASTEARTADAPPRAVIHKATSGSTGRPLTVAYNAESRFWRDATRWRGYGWAGYQPGKRALHFWGAGAEPPGRLARWKIKADRALNRNLYLDCTPRGDDHLATVVDAIRRFRPEVIVTYSQAGAALARYVIRTGARTWGDIPVLCGAERVFPHDREALAEGLGPAFETYGAREVQLVASECEVHDGLHTSMEMLVVELIVREPDGTIRAARPGETGEVVVTDLHNLAQPLIRYVIGDLAVARPDERCACGRWLRRIGPIEGRVTETLRDGRGDPVGGLVFSILFVVIAKHASQFQAHQRADDRVILKVVPTDPAGLPPEAHERIRAFFDRYLPGIAFEVVLCDDIPAGAAGKRTLVIVEPRAPAAKAAGG